MSYSVNSILKKIIKQLYKNGSDLRTFQSVPTIFYVQRKGDFSIKNVPIPYENSVTNTGGAMDETKRIFTAPRNGVYFFGFSGIGTFNGHDYLDVYLMKNGNLVGVPECYSVTAGDWEALSFQLTIHLKAGALKKIAEISKNSKSFGKFYKFLKKIQ